MGTGNRENSTALKDTEYSQMYVGFLVLHSLKMPKDWSELGTKDVKSMCTSPSIAIWSREK